jgi:hypothetical protein
MGPEGFAAFRDYHRESYKIPSIELQISNDIEFPKSKDPKLWHSNTMMPKKSIFAMPQY